MDGNRFIPDSSFLLNKCGRRVDDGVDWINELPDEIIVVILSFLSLREAASTSVLSPRWLDLWKYTPNLDFTEDILNFNLDTRVRMSWVQIRSPRSWDAEKCKYIALVNSVLQSHKAPSLKQFSTSFYVNKSAHLKVAKWLEFVSLKGVERLKLDFKCEDPTYQVVLEELLIGSGGLLQTDYVISFKSLKSLCLQRMIVSGEAIEMLLRNCPLLEALIIVFATLTSDVEVCGATLMLKHLEVYGCIRQKSIKVSAPNLTSLVVDDSSKKLLLENVPKLVKADFGFGFRCESLDDFQRFASAVFCFCSQLKVLNLRLYRPEIFLANGFYPQMPNLKRLTIRYTGVKTQSLLPVTSLIWASPRLEEFKLVFGEIRDAPEQVVGDVERSPHRHLKLFELEGFMKGTVRHVELVNYICDNCVALEKIIIRSSPLSEATYYQYHPFDTLQVMKAACVYDAQQQLQGKVPQHIQLQIR